MAKVPLFVFIDEGGDFNFTPTGSRVYTITAVITHNPCILSEEMSMLKHNILSGEIHSELGQEYLEKKLCHRFHACEDKQIVRDSFFEIISKMDNSIVKAHSIVIKKNLANPSLRNPIKFYSMVVSSLLDYIFKKYEYTKLCIFVDNIPISRQKDVFLKTIKTEIKNKQPQKEFMIYFPTSSSNDFLQVGDYINWAIFRKWEIADIRSYQLIEKFLSNKELDMFSRGNGLEYYQFKK